MAGPCARPDELRLALGLPRLAEFRLPDGRIEVAALPGGEGFGRVEAQVVKRDGRLYDDEGDGDGWRYRDGVRDLEGVSSAVRILLSDHGAVDGRERDPLVLGGPVGRLAGGDGGEGALGGG